MTLAQKKPLVRDASADPIMSTSSVTEQTIGEATTSYAGQTTTLSSPPPRWPSSSPNARPEYQVFAERLHEAMLKNKMNASQVAREVWGTTTDSRGVTVARNRDRIRHYLAGTSYPEPENLKKLANAVGLPVEDLTIERPPTLPSPSTPGVPRGSMIDPQVTILSTHHSVCLLQMRRLVSLNTTLKIMELLGQDVVPDISGETTTPVPAKA